MANANTHFGGFLTNVGVVKQTNANALQIPWKITRMELGDAGGEPALFPDPTPSPTQTALINVVYDAPLNALYPSPTDPGVLIAELVLPPNVGGWWIRETALRDEDGDLIAVAAPAPSYKPLLVQNTGRTQTIRMHIVVGNTANIALKIDPSVVLATRAVVEAGDAEARAYAQQLAAQGKEYAEGLVEDAATEATQEEAEAGENGTRKMTPRRVFQALRSALAKATETVRGTLRIGTQAEVDAGELADVAVTPSTLSHGLLYSFGANGYFFLPSWLTGFGFQWGVAANGNLANGTRIPFPLAFPVQCFGVVPIALNQGAIQGIETAYIHDWTPSDFMLITQVQVATGGQWYDGPVGAFWLAIGR